MGYAIDIRDAVMGALVDLVGRTGEREVSLATASEYGRAIAHHLAREGHEATFYDTREDFARMVDDCGDILEMRGLDGPDASVTLREGVPKEELLDRLVASLPLDAFKAMVSEDALRVVRAT